MIHAKFALGNIYFTEGVSTWIGNEPTRNVSRVHNAINRYVRGDWGNMDDEDIETNHEALLYGMRLMGVYDVDAEEDLWIITNADRLGTTILWPSEY